VINKLVFRAFVDVVVRSEDNLQTIFKLHQATFPLPSSFSHDKSADIG